MPSVGDSTCQENDMTATIKKAKLVAVYDGRVFRAVPEGTHLDCQGCVADDEPTRQLEVGHLCRALSQPRKGKGESCCVEKGIVWKEVSV